MLHAASINPHRLRDAYADSGRARLFWAIRAVAKHHCGLDWLGRDGQATTIGVVLDSGTRDQLLAELEAIHRSQDLHPPWIEWVRPDTDTGDDEIPF
jgi:hypothetical protein